VKRLSVLGVAAAVAAIAAAARLGRPRSRPAPDPATTAARRRLSIVAGQLPLMLEPRAARALLLGWGDGSAASSMLSHPLAELDVAVLPEEASAPDAAAAAPAAAGEPLGDSRLALHRESVEAALAGPGPAYDVIVCDAVCGERAYHLAAARLSPRGLAVFRAAAPDTVALREAVRRALRHFPSVSVWRVLDGDAVLLCARRPPRDVARLDELFRRAAPAAWLRPLGLSYPATLLSLESAGDATARQLAWGRLAASPWPAIDDRATPEGRRRLLLALYLKQRGRALQPREYLEILLHPRGRQETPVFRGLLEEWVRRFPDDPRALAFLCVVEEREGHAEAAARLRRRLAALHGRGRGGPPRGRIVIPEAPAAALRRPARGRPELIHEPSGRTVGG